MICLNEFYSVTMSRWSCISSKQISFVNNFEMNFTRRITPKLSVEIHNFKFTFSLQNCNPTSFRMFRSTCFRFSSHFHTRRSNGERCLQKYGYFSCVLQIDSFWKALWVISTASEQKCSRLKQKNCWSSHHLQRSKIQQHEYRGRLWCRLGALVRIPSLYWLTAEGAGFLTREITKCFERVVHINIYYHLSNCIYIFI